MRISHGQLEAARRDASAWLRERTAAAGRGRRRGYSQILKQAVYAFHKQNGDRAAALDYLTRAIATANLQNATRISKAELDLEAYMDWCEQTRTLVTNHRLRVSLPLGAGLILGGEVSRADYLPGKGAYRAVLLVADHWSPTWDAELRMPLLQRAVAQVLDRDETDVFVGFQGLGGGPVVQRNFTSPEIDRAAKAGRKIAEAIGRAESEQL